MKWVLKGTIKSEQQSARVSLISQVVNKLKTKLDRYFMKYAGKKPVLIYLYYFKKKISCKCAN